jgi:hypothetical protein
MNVRAIVMLGVALLMTAGVAAASPPITELRVEWETVARGDKAIVRGYVYNEHRMRVERVRLRIEQLDASARPIATRSTWVAGGTLAYGDRQYFETAVPAAGATYRVSVESFDLSGCGDG